jgi:hypothetical protein
MFDTEVLGRPAVEPFVFIVRTGRCEAAAAGEVRAITERFSTEEGGRLTLPLELAGPNALCRVGEKPAPFLTCAPRSEASLTCAAPRLMACPPVNAVREAAVTACVLCA